jgi:hypothetical protein
VWPPVGNAFQRSEPTRAATRAKTGVVDQAFADGVGDGRVRPAPLAARSDLPSNIITRWTKSAALTVT